MTATAAGEEEWPAARRVEMEVTTDDYPPSGANARHNPQAPHP